MKVQPSVLVTGGCGFIGSNLVERLLSLGERVVVLDNVSRPGVERNLEELRRLGSDRLDMRTGDVRDPDTVAAAMRDAVAVFHLAAQVAVTTSLEEPRHDFEVNALGTLNVLEAARRRKTPPPLFFTSTSRVYGALADVPLVEGERRWEPADPALASTGVSETRPLDFQSPHGCSKGSAEQYVLDYARSFGVPATVFRTSGVYGPRQRGTEDQGWVAHFVARALDGAPITLFGDGKQVRDLLVVDDLIEAFLAAWRAPDAVRGEAFNVGGGPERAVSLLELLDLIAELSGERPAVRMEPWRPGDRRWWVSDSRKLGSATGWRPRVRVPDGLARLWGWLLHEPAPAAEMPLAASRRSDDAGRAAGLR